MAVSVAVLGGLPKPPAWSQPPPRKAASSTGAPELLFPVKGRHRFSDTFGAPRPGGRQHAGADIFAAKRTPVVAAADGVVEWMHDQAGGRCCAVGLKHDEGWRTRYIHLDNDTPGTDDGQIVGIAEGLRVGGRVAAGELIGWVGDSGNAEHTPPHLHFELLRPDRQPLDPVEPLVAALGRGRRSPAPASAPDAGVRLASAARVTDAGSSEPAPAPAPSGGAATAEPAERSRAAAPARATAGPAGADPIPDGTRVASVRTPGAARPAADEARAVGPSPAAAEPDAFLEQVIAAFPPEDQGWLERAAEGTSP